MILKKKKDLLKTASENTWCPGCPNHMILEAVRRTVQSFIDSKKLKREDFAITADVGCHAKIFDYLNLSGIYGLHGRALPLAIGMKIGNPNLKVLSFMGDGAAYSEGISHLAHAFAYNANHSLIVHDNQSFSLTTGQATPTSQQNYKTKAEPLGVFDKPVNPIKFALSMNGSFIARTNARDINHMVEVFRKAINHNGFSFVEVIQDCIIFNLEENNKDPRMYKIRDNFSLEKAHRLAEEYDYNSKKGKIPLGVLYKSLDTALEDKWPQLRFLKKKKINWQKKPKSF